SKAVEHLLQRRHGHSRSRGERRSGTRVETTQLVEGEGLHQAPTVRRAVDVGIVDDDGDAVARDANVELERVGADRYSLVQRCDRVFRCPGAVAAVGDYNTRIEIEERVLHLAVRRA